MEVSLLSNRGIGSDMVLSIRAGTTRRQAPISSARPFRFPKFPSQETPLKIDVLRQVATAYVVQKPGGDQQYKVEFGGDGLAGACLELGIGRVAEGAGAPPAADGEEADERELTAGARCAKEGAAADTWRATSCFRSCRPSCRP
ncbi:unnamed protein product [Prorocentrum cordatum]|uniref:Uncharacterized protein n=1 Tax=Prorocentrum cordatum TaxID=2364126 RepID=A0ABN9V4A2_9DINO|nr:unnamed protein product [Polarella glacialis]